MNPHAGIFDKESVIENFILNVSLYAVPLLLGVVTHEVAHGWMAEKFGDPTARMMGRITLNPIVHIDLMGTIILPLILLFTKAPFLFGWAKPVPVNFNNLTGGRRSMAWVAMAGPMTNFLMAAASAAIYHLIFAGFKSGWIPAESIMGSVAEPIFLMAGISVQFNLVLMVINLLPIPPLDGGRIAVGLLPPALAFQLERLERFGILIVLLLIATGVWGYIVRPVLAVFMQLLLG
ncbi:site-2 protease family protein [Desulfoferrobacter suflitae]|uniref:site-2 protease family protein n=1 Tax=Desulfoferrobacter suflitae TaxID=2865782 RepID=UPI002164B2F9|nr:site-2 protease family protein [Desulfoferrobacter suflitae]MCK8601453.1 site-2 protease family protein [Desulfoferrobacter suflitae]